MANIGFKKLIIGVHGDDGTISADKVFEINGKGGKGATVAANITGLSSEPVKVYGSDVLYYVQQKGTGEVEVDFQLLDMPEEVNDIILGYKKEGDISLIGEDTEAPYVSCVLESETLSGEKALLGFFKGKMNKESVDLATKEGENVTPEAETYKLNAMASDVEGPTLGQTVAKYVGAEDETFKTLVMPTIPAI